MKAKTVGKTYTAIKTALKDGVTNYNGNIVNIMEALKTFVGIGEFPKALFILHLMVAFC